MLKSLIGFAVGALSTFLLLNWLWVERDTSSDITLSNDSYEPSIRKEHESFRLSGRILFNGAARSNADDHYDPGAMRLERKTKLSNIGPDDLLHVCFTQWVDDDLSMEEQDPPLELNVFFTKEARARLMPLLENNPDKHLTLEYLDYTLSHIWPQADVTEFAKGFYANRPEYDFAPKPGDPPREGDLSIRGPDDKYHGILRVARYLSPNAVPVGCEETFNSDYHHWWQVAIDDLWGNKPLTKEQQIRKDVNEAFRGPKS